MLLVNAHIQANGSIKKLLLLAASLISIERLTPTLLPPMSIECQKAFLCVNLVILSFLCLSQDTISRVGTIVRQDYYPISLGSLFGFVIELNHLAKPSIPEDCQIGIKNIVYLGCMFFALKYGFSLLLSDNIRQMFNFFGAFILTILTSYLVLPLFLPEYQTIIFAASFIGFALGFLKETLMPNAAPAVAADEGHHQQPPPRLGL